MTSSSQDIQSHLLFQLSLLRLVSTQSDTDRNEQGGPSLAEQHDLQETLARIAEAIQ